MPKDSTSVRETQAVEGQVTCAVLVTSVQQQERNHRGGGVSSLSFYSVIKGVPWHTHRPVEQLQGHGVSVIVGHHIHSLVAQTQVSRQSLHHTGLLEDGVLVGSLGGPAGGNTS